MSDTEEKMTLLVYANKAFYGPIRRIDFSKIPRNQTQIKREAY
jgi:hypothetical protein